MKRIVTCFSCLFGYINWFMAFLFSDTNAHLRKEGVFEYCKVKHDADGTRSFTFLFRRYNFCQVPNTKTSIGTENTEKDATAQGEEDDAVKKPEEDQNQNNKSSLCGAFIPGSWPMAETLGQLSQLGNNKVGLSDEDVKDRYRVVGPNTIEMIKPTFLRALRQEFAKPFYTYQLFLIWTWFPVSSNHLAMSFRGSVSHE
jgi:hypothetical protein